MKHITPKRKGQRGQQGWALLMLMFFLAMLLLSMAVAAPTVINDRTREKETEMVWRGKQYVRGIRLYYQKMHRFPVELDDLTKPKTGLRFMRQAYKDPMNGADGSWRMIYLGPGGVLIGSLKTKCLNAALPAQAVVSNFGSPVGASSGFRSGLNSSQSSSFGSSFSTSFNSGSSSSSSDSTSSGSVAAACGGQTTDSSGNSTSGDTMGQPHDIASSDPPQPIVGGSIIGVGSKINKQSLRWYENARNYRLFEFVWDPTIDVITGQRIGTIPGAVTPGTVNPLGPGSQGNNQGNNPNPVQTQNPPLNPNAPDMPPLQAPPNP